jgi:hypothetical protein
MFDLSASNRNKLGIAANINRSVTLSPPYDIINPAAVFRVGIPDIPQRMRSWINFASK